MEHSTTFARFFSRLVWLLISDSGNVAEQKMSLRAVAAVGKEGATRLWAGNGGGLYANGEPMPRVLPGVNQVVERMKAGGLVEIEFERHPAPGEVLGLARLLAAVDPAVPDPDDLYDRLMGLRAETLRFVPVEDHPLEPPAAAWPMEAFDVAEPATPEEPRAAVEAEEEQPEASVGESPEAVASGPMETVEPEPEPAPGPLEAAWLGRVEAVEPEPAEAVEPEPEPEPAPGPLEAAWLGRVEAVEPEPVEAVEPEPEPEPERAPGPLEAAWLGRVEAVEPEPVEAVEPEPAEAVEPEPVEAVEPEPVEAVEPEPVEAVEPEPVEAVEPEPVEAVEPEPVGAVEPEPVGAGEPEPVEAAEPEAVLFSEVELAGATTADGITEALVYPDIWAMPAEEAERTEEARARPADQPPAVCGEADAVRLHELESSPIGELDADTGVSGLVSQDSGGLFFQFSVIGGPKDSPESLLERLGRSTSTIETMRLLDEIVVLAETAVREGKPQVALDLIHGVITQEPSAAEGDMRRAYVMAVRRLSKPLLLRAVAAQLVAAPARRGAVMEVLVRMEQDGAEAVIDQITQARTAEDRRVLFTALQHLAAAEAALVHMLGDARWFIARNAADLLGEMQATKAEGPLVSLLRHDDDRVRRAATSALMHLGTQSARQAVREAVRDETPHVRTLAAFAIATDRDPRTAATLITAIDAEQNRDVQMAMLLALGRVGTKEAVERLIRAAEPERGLFRRKPREIRIAAAQALAEVNSLEVWAARGALEALTTDRDREVREAAVRLLRRDPRT